MKKITKEYLKRELENVFVEIIESLNEEGFEIIFGAYRKDVKPKDIKNIYFKNSRIIIQYNSEYDNHCMIIPNYCDVDDNHWGRLEGHIAVFNTLIYDVVKGTDSESGDSENFVLKQRMNMKGISKQVIRETLGEKFEAKLHLLKDDGILSEYHCFPFEVNEYIYKVRYVVKIDTHQLGFIIFSYDFESDVLSVSDRGFSSIWWLYDFNEIDLFSGLQM